MNRRLLFLAYWVPPRRAIGSVRSSHLLKHLPKFGWDVTAVTAGLGSENGARATAAPYVETGYVDVKGSIKRIVGIRNNGTSSGSSGGETQRTAMRGIVTAVSSVVSYPDDYVGWLPYAVRKTRRLVSNGGWDALLTSAPPMTTNLVAALSHKRTPWIADLRDLWAEDDSNKRTMMQTLFDDRLERTTLSRASALIASSDLSAARFQRRYPGKPCFAAYNGFDADEWRGVEFGAESRCTLLYAGNLYGGKRDPSLLFLALRRMLDTRTVSADAFAVDFYAPRDPWLMKLIAEYELRDIVTVHGFIERREVLAPQRRADRLIVLSWDGPTAEGVVAGKLFEYFGARRPVLAIGGPERFVVDDLLRATGAGVRCRTLEEIQAELLVALAEHRGRGPRVIPESAVSDYCGESCAKRFAEVLDSVVPARAKM